MKVLLLLILMSLTACSSSTLTESESKTKNQIEVTTKVATKTVDTEASCDKSGTLQAVCRSQTLKCIYTYSDAGKTCHGSRECEGKCQLNDINTPAGTVTAGACSTNNNPCGCFTFVEKGVAQQTICID